MYGKITDGYILLSAAVERLAEQGRISEQQAKQRCHVYKFMSECNDAEYVYLFESGVFNDFVNETVARAMCKLGADGVLDDDQVEAVRQAISFHLP